MIIIIKAIYLEAAHFQYLKNLLLNNKIINMFHKIIRYLKKINKIKSKNKFMKEIKL
jgi:hypothetical protein